MSSKVFGGKNQHDGGGLCKPRQLLISEQMCLLAQHGQPELSFLGMRGTKKTLSTVPGVSLCGHRKVNLPQKLLHFWIHHDVAGTPMPVNWPVNWVCAQKRTPNQFINH